MLLNVIQFSGLRISLLIRSFLFVEKSALAGRLSGNGVKRHFAIVDLQQQLPVQECRHAGG